MLEHVQKNGHDRDPWGQEEELDRTPARVERILRIAGAEHRDVELWI